MADTVCTLLDGTRITATWLDSALFASPSSPGHRLVEQLLPRCSTAGTSRRRVVSAEVCSTVTQTGQSTSVQMMCMCEVEVEIEIEGTAGTTSLQQLQLPLYIKRVDASSFPGKKDADLRRDLRSCHNECVFYAEVAGRLRTAGFVVPLPVHVASHEATLEHRSLFQNGATIWL